MHVFKKNPVVNTYLFRWTAARTASPEERGCILQPAKKDPVKGKIRTNRKTESPHPNAA
jgi:hypothetical protein